MNKLIGVKELREILGCSGSWIYDQVQKGSLPAYKLNGLIRFDMGEVKKWLKERRISVDDEW